VYQGIKHKLKKLEDLFLPKKRKNFTKYFLGLCRVRTIGKSLDFQNPEPESDHWEEGHILNPRCPSELGMNRSADKKKNVKSFFGKLVTVSAT
jgi:hypothetical protein